VLWTIAIVALLLLVRIQHLSAGGSPKDFGVQNDRSLLWRLLRVQSNLVENLPLYLGFLFLLTVRDVSGVMVNSLIVLHIIFRLVHSIVHIAGLNPNLRVVSLGVQFVCLVALIVMAIA
jgi:uncharacterized MAPEG superfamily protein